MYSLSYRRGHLLLNRCSPSVVIPSFRSRRLLPQFAAYYLNMPKRKSLSSAPSVPAFTTAPIPLPQFERGPPPPSLKKRPSGRKLYRPASSTGSTNPNKNANVLDAPEALRASPDASEADEMVDVQAAGMDVDKQVKKEEDDESSSLLTDIESPVKQKRNVKKSKPRKKDGEEVKTKPVTETESAGKTKASAMGSEFLDPEAEGDEEADEEELQAALSRPPPVHSDYLPLPWKGRLGYVS